MHVDWFFSLCALNRASVAPLASLAGRIVNLAVDSSTESGGRVGSNVVRPSLLKMRSKELRASGKLGKLMWCFLVASILHLTTL